MPASRYRPRPTRCRADAGRAALRLLGATIVAEWAELTGDVVTTGSARERDVRGCAVVPAHVRSVRLEAGEWVEWVGVGRERWGRDAPRRSARRGGATGGMSTRCWCRGSRRGSSRAPALDGALRISRRWKEAALDGARR